jgi:hypothetical protein
MFYIPPNSIIENASNEIQPAGERNFPGMKNTVDRENQTG